MAFVKNNKWILSMLLSLGLITSYWYLSMENDIKYRNNITRKPKQALLLKENEKRSALRLPASSSQSPSSQGSVSLKKPDNLSEIEQIKWYLRCQEQQNCYLDSKSDPRSYNFVIAKGIEILVDTIKENKVSIPQMKIFKMAKDLLNNEDTLIKASGLDLLSLLPASDENLQLIVASGLQSHHPELVTQSLQELHRYFLETQNPEQIKWRTQISSQITKILASSSTSLYVKESIAKSLTPYLDEENYTQIKNISNGLILGSPLRQRIEQLTQAYEESLKNKI